MGLDSWRHAAPARAELGWKLSGYGRSIKAAVLRRARLFSLPAEDMYRRVFEWAGHAPGRTWAKKSRETLDEWGIQDFPNFGGTFPQYKEYVTATLAARCLSDWQEEVVGHPKPLPYLSFQATIGRGVGGAMETGKHTWENCDGPGRGHGAGFRQSV